MGKVIIALALLTTPAMAETTYFYGNNGEMFSAQSVGGNR